MSMPKATPVLTEQPQKGHLSPSLLGLNAIAVVGVGGALLSALMPERVAIALLKASPAVCTFKAVTHCPCLFCGMTRAFVSIGHGDWVMAERYHLLSIPLFGAMLACLLVSAVSPATAEQLLLLIRRGLRRPPVLVLAGVLLVAAWGVKLAGDPQYW